MSLHSVLFGEVVMSELNEHERNRGDAPMIPSGTGCQCHRGELKARFRAAENNLLAALNGWQGREATEDELTCLRREVMQARQACGEHGIETETLWEFAQRLHARDEARTRRYAEELYGFTPSVTYLWRKRYARAAGVCVAFAVLTVWATPGGVLGALVAGFIAFAIVEDAIAWRHPTASSLIGRMAAQLAIDVSDLWPEGSDELNDYRRELRRHKFWMKSGGGHAGRIKAR